MNPHDLLAGWSAWWWPLVAAHLWQSTLFLAAAAIAVLTLRRASAGARHGAWLICSLKFAVPALLLATPLGWLGISRSTIVPYVAPASVIEQWTNREPAAVSSQPSAVSRQASSSHTELYCLLTVTWFAGLVFLGTRWLCDSRRLARLVSESRKPEDPRLLAALKQASHTLRLKRKVSLVASSAISTPAAYGILKPVVVVPSNIADALHGVELEAVLMHELMHIKRFDNLTATFQRLLCWFFWFHPFVWLLDRRLLSERELSCDEAVVTHSGQPRAYAAGILKICRFSFRASPAGLSLASGSSLGRRIRMITGQSPQCTRSSHHLVLAALVAGSLLFSVAVAPQAAQNAPAQELKLGTCTECPVALLEATLSHEGAAEETPRSTIRVRNDGNRPVKSFYLVLENPTVDQRVYFSVSERLAPGETKKVEVRARRATVAVQEAPKRIRLETVRADEARKRIGDLSQVEAKVPTVVFADDTSFTLKGYLPAPPPPPPAPPAAPAPPAPPAPSDRGAPPALPEIPAPPAPPPAPPAPPVPPDSEDDKPIMGGVIGGVPGGVKGGVPGGVVGGVPGGVKKETPKPAPAPVPKPNPAPSPKQ